jgi:mono/diheme cytochrome c family protein
MRVKPLILQTLGPIWLLAGFAPTLRLGQPLPAPGAAGLMAELGCAYCHTDLKIASSLRDRTPDLSFAGLRYQPAWMFEFLQNPVAVRHHLGRARMPGFHLSPKEALALAVFLGDQQHVAGAWPPLPDAVRSQLTGPAQAISRSQFQSVIAQGLICFTCHMLNGQGGTIGVELGNISYQLQPAWVRRYLVSPAMFGVPPATMPAQFYQVANDGKRFKEMTPGAARKIQVVTDYLFSLNGEKRRALEEKWTAARAAYPDATASLGKALFVALNCVACHRHDSLPPRPQNAAPELALEGRRVTPAWLRTYLRRPTAIRPFGNRPGDGGRMPDFRLSEPEAEELAAFLSAERTGAEPLSREFQPQPLTAFSRAKTKRLLVEKLSCLGCHRLGDQGGRIGPDLTAVPSRLQPAYVYAIIKDPRGLLPHTVMPQIPLPERTVRLIANFLLDQKEQPALEPAYLSPVNHPLIPYEGFEAAAPAPANNVAKVSSMVEARRRYLTYCAACHGPEGRGDGFNVPFLPVAPTAHADPVYMATRPDDTLYDGIHSGGLILNKSARMPPWGRSLTPNEITGLVKFLRTLCHCQGPAWSLDSGAE